MRREATIKNFPSSAGLTNGTNVTGRRSDPQEVLVQTTKALRGGEEIVTSALERVSQYSRGLLGSDVLVIRLTFLDRSVDGIARIEVSDNDGLRVSHGDGHRSVFGIPV